MSNEQKFLIDCVTDDVAHYIMEDYGLSVVDALDIIYTSQFYDKLSDVQTGLYYQSSPYNYEYLTQELKYGKVA